MQLKNDAVKTIFDLFPSPGTEAGKYIYIFAMSKIPVEMLQFQTGTCNVILNVKLLKTAVCRQHKRLVLYLFKCSLFAAHLVLGCIASDTWRAVVLMRPWTLDHIPVPLKIQLKRHRTEMHTIHQHACIYYKMSFNIKIHPSNHTVFEHRQNRKHSAEYSGASV